MSLTLSHAERAALEPLIQLGLAEDLAEIGDITCNALIEETLQGEVAVTARTNGTLSGGPVAAAVFQQLDDRLDWTAHLADGSNLDRGTVIATIRGPLGSLLTGERTALNFLTHPEWDRHADTKVC